MVQRDTEVRKGRRARQVKPENRKHRPDLKDGSLADSDAPPPEKAIRKDILRTHRGPDAAPQHPPRRGIELLAELRIPQGRQKTAREPLVAEPVKHR